MTNKHINYFKLQAKNLYRDYQRDKRERFSAESSKGYKNMVTFYHSVSGSRTSGNYMAGRQCLCTGESCRVFRDSLFDLYLPCSSGGRFAYRYFSDRKIAADGLYYFFGLRYIIVYFCFYYHLFCYIYNITYIP